MSRPKGPGRLQVEEVLRENGHTAFTPDAVAARTGLPLPEVRQHLSNATNRGTIHRPPGPGPGAQYQWGPPPVAIARDRRHTTAPGGYQGGDLRPFVARPGAMDAFTLPSLQGGRRVERVAPRSISTSVRELRKP
ncbi:MAG: hypothetical protein QG643_2430 [Pseudomonadota bacterium]|nr:hypothetical protein [Pseudomonadota bacterium]